MTDSGGISWHRVMEEVEEPLDAIAKEINATTTAVSCGKTYKIPWMPPKEAEYDEFYLGILMGRLTGKIKGPGRWLGFCSLKRNGELYVSWTVD